jgi:hypothetical protein
MGSFDWTELDTLTRDIEYTQSRLDAARATKNHGLVTLLQQEIAEAAKRRARVLVEITKALGGSASGKRHPRPALVREPQLKNAEGEQQVIHQVERDQPCAENAEPDTTSTLVSPVPRELSDEEGNPAKWDRLTAADIDQAKRAVAQRRSEMLARHAEELKALDTEQTEIDAFERAIGAFATKFKIGGGGEVVPFDPERSMQTQAG